MAKVTYGFGPLDAQSLLRSAGALNANENGTSKSIRGTPERGLVAVMYVPSASGTNPTLDVVIQESADDTNWTAIASFKQVTSAAGMVPNLYFVRFATTLRYVRHVATVGGTTPNFGVVIIALVPHAFGP